MSQVPLNNAHWLKPSRQLRNLVCSKILDKLHRTKQVLHHYNQVHHHHKCSFYLMKILSWKRSQGYFVLIWSLQTFQELQKVLCVMHLKYIRKQANSIVNSLFAAFCQTSNIEALEWIYWNIRLGQSTGSKCWHQPCKSSSTITKMHMQLRTKFFFSLGVHGQARSLLRSHLPHIQPSGAEQTRSILGKSTAGK